ncbi:hypothetical protein GCM10017600_63490 [Streptosporangium carneum]|uniref:Uncharacterized protein n=1 Tax=Streptosporangium carneum TaxID=47481 RepID=A0A9W6MFR9_9ACTN|nr:hypothetical protein GCM10017600_63490 [Streptosporangium carneum]
MPALVVALARAQVSVPRTQDSPARSLVLATPEVRLLGPRLRARASVDVMPPNGMPSAP